MSGQRRAVDHKLQKALEAMWKPNRVANCEFISPHIPCPRPSWLEPNDGQNPRKTGGKDRAERAPKKATKSTDKQPKATSPPKPSSTPSSRISCKEVAATAEPQTYCGKPKKRKLETVVRERRRESVVKTETVELPNRPLAFRKALSLRPKMTEQERRCFSQAEGSAVEGKPAQKKMRVC